MTVQLERIPEPQRDSAAAALTAAFGSQALTALEPVRGGGSGALAYRVEVGGRQYLLRLESGRVAMRNPHQYACMQIAADAGIAPPLCYTDAARGIAIMDFLPQRSLQTYPGGSERLLRDLGALTARLQATPAFPYVGDYPVVLDRMLDRLRKSGVFAAGLLDPHAESFARLREACRWDAAMLVSSHNDPNPGNILYDGERLWLIDWETAFRNDPLVDVAIFAENFAATPELETALLETWSGQRPSRELQARLTLVRAMTRLYYAALIFSGVGASSGSPPITDLHAPTREQFWQDAAAGKYKASDPRTIQTLGMIYLATFLESVDAPGFDEALQIVTPRR
ncbi:MAG TPA: phosphotransferase [Rhizomicrobium sp.]|jgi:aminoglycoside phosphotransferase (APT) family kinase protein